ncbi:MAG TPA: trypsin-like peptidase domain-containing protein, partial [Thermoanaerobaculia bacterium]|nr:trypsin-like peptidase domain-containing protein [Thermoanaerobaculia bacterium]
VSIPLFPLAEGLGVVFRHQVDQPGALGLRLHFEVERAGEAWGVQVLGADGRVAWSTWAGEAPAGRFWSGEIPGARATVEVHSSMPANPLRLTIDRVAVRTDPVTPVSIFGANQLAPIGAQDDWIVQLGRSVARLRFIGDGGSMFVCTAFLVTPDLMLTNQHCIATQSELESALVDFDFDSDAEPPGSVLGLGELIASDFDLDYSLVRLERCVGRQPLRLATARPADQRGLVIIEHPAGEPKQVSILDCAVNGAVVAGRGGGATDFGHSCDTLGGSSGSPVLDFDDRTVVGLHHLGIAPGSGQPFNRAVHVDLVLADLEPAVRAEIENGQ